LIHLKKHLDEWLMREVPDQPKCDGYAGKVAATSNSIFSPVLTQ